MAKLESRVDILNQLVECAGKALRAEEQYLAQCVSKPGGQTGPIGLMQNPNERYYQFVVWRGLLCDPAFRWRPMTERYGHDLAFYEGESERPVAFAEIKGWWSDSGEPEIPGIKRDVEKLEMRKVPGVMLIITCSDMGKTEANLRWLAGKLGIGHKQFVTHRFGTAYPGEKPLESQSSASWWARGKLKPRANGWGWPRASDELASGIHGSHRVGQLVRSRPNRRSGCWRAVQRWIHSESCRGDGTGREGESGLTWNAPATTSEADGEGQGLLEVSFLHVRVIREQFRTVGVSAQNVQDPLHRDA